MGEKVIDMIENKRFINDIDNGKLIDTKGELSTIHYSDSVDFYELWEFLNKLNDENEQLKQDGFYWAETAEARRKEIDKLRKDNNILKQQRDYLFDVIDEVLPHSGSTTVYNRMKDIGDVE